MTTERFVFVATTGRSGTHTLARICANIPGCAAFHEPAPIMNGRVLQAAAAGDDAYVRREYALKSATIRRAAAGARYYVETNHQFVKSFAHLAVDDFGERLAVIHLQRPAVEVASSIYALGSVPGTRPGNDWWLDPAAPTNLVQLSDAPAGQFADPFYLALWYWYEVEARVAAFRSTYPRIPVVTLLTAELNDSELVADRFRRIGINVPAVAISTACVPSDACPVAKTGAAPASALADQMQAALGEFIRARNTVPLKRRSSRARHR